MAKRQIIPVDRVVKCHVHSVDGSASYEGGVAYEAGTLVTYNGTSYTAIIDIEDTDSDTPDEAPDRWAITPNAFGSGNGGGDDLEPRVVALETFENDMPDGYCWVTRDNVSGTYENKTYSEILDALAADLYAVAQGLENDEILVPVKITITGNLSTNIRPEVFTNASQNTNIVFSVVSSTSSNFIFWSGVGYSGTGTSTLHYMTISDQAAIAYNDVSSSSAGASRTAGIQYDIYKKLKTS